MRVLQWFFGLFVGRPETMMLISMVFAILFAAAALYLKGLSKSWPLLVITSFWFVFALWEASFLGQDNPIRIDIIFLLPFGIILTFIFCIAQAAFLSAAKKDKPKH